MAQKIRAFAKKTDWADFLQGAVETAEWIRSLEVRTEHGSYWVAHPKHPDAGQIDLMHGSSGIILFFAELADATGDGTYLDDARRGAEYILYRLDTYGTDDLASGMAGLHYREGTKYTVVSGGASGVAFALTELDKAAPDERYRELALRLTREIAEHAEAVPEGFVWSRKSGFNFDAGTILYLLYAAEAYRLPELTATAVEAARAILSTGTAVPTGGTRYKGFTDMVKVMTGNADFEGDVPNFCYGSAGIGYTFARVYQETGEKAFLDGAIEAADYLKGVAETDGDAALTPYRLPDLPHIHYLSSCHGICGTIRLFYLLYEITGAEEYRDWIYRYHNGFKATGAPELHSNGYWNNYSYCCGTAGYADTYAGLYLRFGDAEFLDYARRNAAVSLSQGFEGDRGLSWYQAFKRIDPTDITREAGYYSGAVGIASSLIRVYLLSQNKAPAYRLLEEPYPIRQKG